MKAWEGERFSVRVDEGVEYVESRGAVAIVAVDRRDRVVLVRQRRPAVGATLFEIPAGFVEEGEKPLATAQRELREETGLHGGTWSHLSSLWPAPGFVRHRLTIFTAHGLDEGASDPDEGEDLETVRWPVADVEARLDEIEDAKTLVGLLLLLRGIRK